MLPKVVFEKLDIDENLDNLVWYARPENSANSPLNFYEFTLELFPELKGKIKEGMTYQEIYLVLDKEVRPILENFYNNNEDIERYASIWEEVNDSVMLALEKRLDIKWPKDIKIICRVGLLPVCPRDIENTTFVLNYGVDRDKLIAISIHEICHFIYFEKWKEINPNYTSEEFDNPHIAWYLSEAMIDPLINNEEFKKYTKEEMSSYSVFYETYIEGKSIIEILREYVNNYSIDEAIKKGYELFKKYESVIKKTL